MVRQAEAEEFLLKYLSSISKDYKISVGLILGQISGQKYQVLHFAKTPPFQTDQEKSEGKSTTNLKSIQDVNENWVADQARQATRMLPGGMVALGVFVVTDEDVLSPFNSKLKSLLNTIHKKLTADIFLYSSGDTEKLILHYSPKTQRYAVKSYDTASSNVQPIDFKFVQKSIKLVTFDCTYQIDQTYYLKHNETSGPLRQHIKVILESIASKLENGIILFDSEIKDCDEKIENMGKKKKRGSSNKAENAEGKQSIGVTIFEKCHPAGDKIEPIKIGGQIRVVGEVVSKLWVSCKGTFGEAVKAVKEDIMRSLSTRMEMHWDSLTEEELSEDINSVHEPPRRVLITLPEGNVTISDYLFPGEGPEDCKLSLEELLDVKIEGHLELVDLEGQADISQYYKEASPPETESEDFLPKITSDSNKMMYLIGLAGAILILVISLLLHFYMKG